MFPSKIHSTWFLNLDFYYKEKWRLTEMTTSELSDLVSASVHWESLRAAQDSYKQYFPFILSAFQFRHCLCFQQGLLLRMKF